MQSRFYTLFLVLVTVGAAVTAFGVWGVLVAAFLMAAVEYVRSAESLKQAMVNVLILLLCCLLLLGLLLPILVESRESYRRDSCWNNLKQLSLALKNYHYDHGCFPPAYLVDEDGKPMHSWRVLILPYIERRDTYEQYKFDEPWDGPNNSTLWGSRPQLFRCPSSESPWSEGTTTNYVAIVGPKTAWPDDRPAKLSEFSDGGKKTILLVEVADSDINWMEPQDLSFKNACRGINKDAKLGISSPHSLDAGYFSKLTNGAMAAFADGRAHFLPDDIAVMDLESMLTRESQKAVYLDRPVPRRFGTKEFVAMCVMLISALLLLIRPRKRRVAVAS